MCGGEDGMVCIVGDVSQQGQPRQQMEGYSRTTRIIGKSRSEIIAAIIFIKEKLPFVTWLLCYLA